jgi:hypothetical protein
MPRGLWLTMKPAKTSGQIRWGSSTRIPPLRKERLVVNADLPANTVPELIKLANERELSYSSPGTGTGQHLSAEYMKQRFGVNMTHVPYRNTPQSIQDIAGGHVQLGFLRPGPSRCGARKMGLTGSEAQS